MKYSIDSNIISIYGTPRVSVHRQSINADVIFWGIPFDNAHTGVPGCRLGPNSIREASLMYGYLEKRGKNFGWYDYDMDKHILKGVSMVDVGNLVMIPAEVMPNFELIKNATSNLVTKCNILATMGGDHSILLPVIEGILTKHKKINIIQIDAHTDFSDEWMSSRYNHGSTMRRISELEGVQNIYQFGIRGLVQGLSNIEASKKRGIKLKTSEDIRTHNYSAEDLDNDFPYYVTLDLDVMDPNIVPCVGSPSPGGFDYATLRRLVYDILPGKNVVGVDIVELNPVFDVNNSAALTSARLLLDMLGAVSS